MFSLAALQVQNTMKSRKQVTLLCATSKTICSSCVSCPTDCNKFYAQIKCAFTHDAKIEKALETISEAFVLLERNN